VFQAFVTLPSRLFMGTDTGAVHRILVVDDEPDITALVAYHLAKEGYRVTTAGTGADALRSAREERPDLVVLDLMLPGHSGFEVLAELRRRDETRDVGVLLPLYRASFDFYGEGAFTSETVDGVSAGYHVFANSPWNVEVAAYGGRYNMTNTRTEYDSTGTPVAVFPELVDVDNALGAQIWVNTPVDGVRAGFGALRMDVRNGGFAGKWSEWHSSLDARTHRVTLQAEYRRYTLPDLTYGAGYVYAGVHASPKVTLLGQVEFSDVVLTTAPGAPEFDYDRTKTVGVSYAFRADLVVKGEYHFTNGYWADAPVTDIGFATAKVRYFLVSFSTSF